MSTRGAGMRPAEDPVEADAYTGYWAEDAQRDDSSIPVEVALGVPGSLLLRVPRSGFIMFIGRRRGYIAISDGCWRYDRGLSLTPWCDSAPTVRGTTASSGPGSATTAPSRPPP